MAPPKDGASPETLLSHANPVTRQGFTQIPNAVMYRGDLSPVAKLLYGYLSHLAWRAQTTEAAPPVVTIMRDLGMSENTVTKAVRELQRAPAREGSEDAQTLLVSRRRGQGKTNAYLIFDPVVDVPDSSPSRSAKTADQDPQGVGNPARARQGSDPKRTTEEENPPSPLPAVVSPDDPPKLQKIEGRDVALDTLCRVCGIDIEGPRIRQAVAALSNKQNGIRRLFWIECRRYIDAHSYTPEQVAQVRADFERALALRIEYKTSLIKERQPWRTSIAPSHVRDLWLDIEQQTARPGGGLSPDQIEKLGAQIRNAS